MARAYIGLGGNLGNPEKRLAEAIEALLSSNGISFRAVSSLYQTDPIDSSGPDYLNAVLEVECTLTPQHLLNLLLEVERGLGRVRPSGVHNAPRTVDLDLLIFDDVTCNTDTLILPHPRLTQRAFVLYPLLEVNPNIRTERLGKLHKYLAKVQNQRIKLIKTSNQWLGDRKWLK